MNTTPRPPTVYPTEFRQIISEKSANFVGREFVFSAINNFLSRHSQGYFTIVGAPGSGKSAILAKYVSENPQVIYYNAELPRKNRAEEFLAIVCGELLRKIEGRAKHPVPSSSNTEKDFRPDASPLQNLPENATSGSWFLSLLLQKISDLLAPNQKLIIAIDALNAIDSTNIPPGSNLFYLPRYLPEKVYFLLTRRPFLREKSGLLIQTPAEVMNLERYPEQNQKDIQLYIEQYLLNNHSLHEPEFIAELTAKSENNFLYVSEILPVVAEKLVAEYLGGGLRNPVSPKETGFLSPGLEVYYQKLWQCLQGEEFSSVKLKVLRSLVNPLPEGENLRFPGRTSAEIAELIDEDEYDVEAVLESWIEFLRLQELDGEIYYMLYHWSFCEFVSRDRAKELEIKIGT
jgi:hypothetical protein